MPSRYYGQFNPPVDKVLHERYFPNKTNGISIECGAYDGYTECCTKFVEENYGWKTIYIEPLSHIFKLLEQNRPASVNLNIALSNNNEDKLFTNFKHPQLGYVWGNGSLSHTVEHKNSLMQLCGKDNYTTETVKCSTYKDIVEQLKLTHLDLFVLDVEGHEVDVISGMVGCDILPDVFVIEHGHRNTSFFVDVIKILNAKYTLDHVSHVNSFFVKIK